MEKLKSKVKKTKTPLAGKLAMKKANKKLSYELKNVKKEKTVV